MSIKVKNLKYIYNQGMNGETLALDDVSFEIFDGEIVGVIGHTGSGKSTLLQHLNALLKPTSGEIFVDGKEITSGDIKLADIRKKVGLVFQYPEYQLFEETVEKDVGFGPKNLGLSEKEIKRRVIESLNLVGLDYDLVAKKSPFVLSGGIKRKVAIAGVIAMNPSTLILDEPCAGLDPKSHREFIQMLKNIHNKTNKTIIIVSHNMADIAELSSKILVLDKGKIIMQGEPKDVFAHEDKLKKIGLDIPPISKVMKEISEKIPEIDSNVFTVDEAVKEILKYKND